MDIRYVTTLIQELKEASEAYYLGDGTHTMTDQDFDNKVLELESIEKHGEYPELFEDETDGYNILNSILMGGSVDVIPENKQIHYTSPMLSLEKAKTPAEIISFIKKTFAAGATSFSLQAKYDGMAFAALYENGKLTRLSSRGDGKIGEDYSYLINSEHVSITGLPKNINTETNHKSVELRGELFFTNEQYETVQKNVEAVGRKPFTLQRSAVSGITKRAMKSINYDAELTFVSYSAYVTENGKGYFPNLSEIGEFENSGVLFAQSYTTQITEDYRDGISYTGLDTTEKVLAAIENFGMVKNFINIPVDGSVIKPENEGEMLEKMGSSSRHPYSQIAWKYPGVRKDSTIRSIIPTVGRTGRITPVAVFDMVVIEGNIENASLHNYNIISKLDVRVGSKVEILKAGDIIPRVERVVENPTDAVSVEIPTQCPECDTTLVVLDDLIPSANISCPNEECPARVIASIVVGVSREFLNIKGLSEAVITALYKDGKISNISDIYSLTVEDFANIETLAKTGKKTKFGEARTKTIMAEMEKAKSIKLEKVLASLTIPGASQNTSKLAVKNFKNIEAIMNLSVEELAAVHGLGEMKAKAMVEGLAKRKHIIEKFADAGFTALSTNHEPEAIEKSDPNETSTDVDGNTFAITGNVPSEFNNRNEFIEFIENNGGTFSKAPSAKTTYVIGDATSSSSKMQKALSLGLEVILPEDFAKRFMK